MKHFIVMLAVAVFALIGMYEIVDAAELKEVTCTAYCNPKGNKTATGADTIEGLTIAGKEEWLGCVAVLYEINEDGSIGQFIGYRQFTDTGYGKESKNYAGMGTIQSGETVDIFLNEREECFEWGERKILIQVVEGNG